MKSTYRFPKRPAPVSHVRSGLCRPAVFVREENVAVVAFEDLAGRFNNHGLPGSTAMVFPYLIMLSLLKNNNTVMKILHSSGVRVKLCNIEAVLGPGNIAYVENI